MKAIAFINTISSKQAKDLGLKDPNATECPVFFDKRELESFYISDEELMYIHFKSGDFYPIKYEAEVFKELAEYFEHK